MANEFLAIFIFNWEVAFIKVTSFLDELGYVGTQNFKIL